MNKILLKILKKKQTGKKYDPTNLFLREYSYSKWYKEPDDDDGDIDDTPLENSDELIIYHPCNH